MIVAVLPVSRVTDQSLTVILHLRRWRRLRSRVSVSVSRSTATNYTRRTRRKRERNDNRLSVLLIAFSLFLRRFSFYFPLCGLIGLLFLPVQREGIIGLPSLSAANAINAHDEWPRGGHLADGQPPPHNRQRPLTANK